MSTRFTNKIALPSLEIPLGQRLIHAHQWVTQSMLNLMLLHGHENLTSTHLTFISSLDCGKTHAAEVARRMGISRQAVYKITRELQKLGILTLEVDPEDKRQKTVNMTALGERVVTDARASLSAIEIELTSRIGHKHFDQLSASLKQDFGPFLGSTEA